MKTNPANTDCSHSNATHYALLRRGSYWEVTFEAQRSSFSHELVALYVAYPPLKLVIGSVTTSAALMLGGVALMVLPSLIFGNELLILGGVGIAVGAWFLAHRHGHLRGIVVASTGTSTGNPPAKTQDSAS